MKVLIIILFLAIPLFTQAAGIQVSPDKLEFVLTNKKSQTQEIVVVNPTADVQLFEVFTDDYAFAIKLLPESFTLESGARRNIKVIVDPNKLPSGLLSTQVSIVGKPLSDSRVQVNTAVKIPITITQTQDKNQRLVILIGLLVLIMLSGLVKYFGRGWPST